VLAGVAIINYKTGGLVADCLASLDDERRRVRDAFPGRGDVRVVVVDNASPDDSADAIDRAINDSGWGEWATLVRLPRNGGFAYGNNEAVRPMLAGDDGPAYVWLLNPDTLVRPGGLVELIRFLDDDPDAGIAGSRLEDPDGTPQRSAFRFPTVRSELENAVRFGPVSRLLSRHVVAPPVPEGDDPRPVDWMAGASLLCRREVFDRAGYMDEGYFMYFEEVAFCRQAARAGFGRWYVPRSRVVHLVGQASGVTAKGQTKRRPAYWFDSRRRYFLTQLGGPRATLADAAWLGGYATYRLRRRLQRKPDTDPQGLLADFARNSVFARGWRARP